MERAIVADEIAIRAGTVDDSSYMAKVLALEGAIARELPPVECPITHHFSKGVYAREMFIPKGTVITGKIHKFENLSIISKGDVSIYGPDGVVRVQAPYTYVAPPGTKRAVFAHEDTVWTSIHGTDERDLAKIEEEFVVDTAEQYLAFCDVMLQLEGA